MKLADGIHLALGGGLAALGVLSLCRDWSWGFSRGVLVVLCLYIVVLLLECAHHSKRDDKSNRFFELPNREWALLLVALFVVTNVFAFANIYVQTGSIEFEDSNCKSEEVDSVEEEKPENCIQTMTSKTDAVYFSAVTVTTLGYGEFTPKSTGRIIVVWHLASGLLLLLVLIPVAAARVSDW